MINKKIKMYIYIYINCIPFGCPRQLKLSQFRSPSNKTLFVWCPVQPKFHFICALSTIGILMDS